MKVQLFKNPFVYFLVTAVLFAVISFAVSATSGVDRAKVIGAPLAGIVFGVIVTFWMHHITEPPASRGDT